MNEASTSGLKPAEVEPGALRKLRLATVLFCVAELWALVFGSGLLYSLGFVRNAVLLWSVGFASVTWGLLPGYHIETWLAILSREPLLNERDEMDPSAPMERSAAYLFPPLVAAFGVIGVVMQVAVIPLLTSGISLVIFGYLMRRIWRVRRHYLSTLGAAILEQRAVDLPDPGAGGRQ